MYFYENFNVAMQKNGSASSTLLSAKQRQVDLFDRTHAPSAEAKVNLYS